MADTEDFSSLDPLGPEYGRSDLPTMDSKGLSAFEGDTLKDPIINFPVVPKIQNLELPQHDVHQYVVNKAPKVQGVPSPKLDFNAFKNAHRNYTLAKMATGADKSTYGKIYSYNAGPDGNAFYDRYAAYGPETFAKVGFSPLRDNEALFNSRTTMWDDHKRMMQNSFWPLFANGFVAGPKSLGKMLTGDFTGADLEESRAYTDAAAIGQTTKSGWGMGFANNLLMNFAYSAGIITEAIAEEAVAIALAPETMGGSVFLATANATRNLSKLGTGFKLLKGVEATKDVTNGLRAVNNTLKAVDNVKDARTFWQTAKGVVTSTMSPLKNTFTNLGDINQIVTKGGKSYNLTNLAKIYKTAGGFYKDVRNFNMALSEARLEAGIVENQIYDNGYNQYYDKFGEAPSDKVQKELLRNAKEGSLDTLYWNTALIYVSNSITFNNLLGPRGGVGGFMRNTMKEVGSIGGGKFGSLGKVIYNQSKKVFQFQANTAKGLVKSWASQPIYKSAMGTLAYFKRNFTEGIQENLQEVISGANEKYYSDSFEQSAIRSHEYHKGLSRYNLKSQNKYLTEEFKGQFSARGAETFASGFFMGMLAAPLNAAVPNMLVGYNRMFNKEAYQKFKADKLEITKGVIENLNSIGIKEFLDNKIFNLSTQEAVATIKRTGTKKEAHDADMEGFVKQMSHVLRNGVMDVYIEKLQAEKQLSPEEFEERVPNIPKGEGAKYLAKIDDVIARAKKLEKRYKYYTDKHPNPVTAANLPPINTPEYEDAIALHTAWEDGIEKAIYFNEAFENTMQRKVDIESTFVAEAPLKNMSSRDSSVLFNDKELQNEIGLLKNEIDTLKDLNDPKSQEQYAAKVRKLAVMEKLYSASTGFKNFFNRYDNAEQVRAALQKDKGSEPVTDEEVEAALSSVLGEFTEDNKEKITTDYEGAYKEYLQEIASVNGDYIFDQKIDESFKLLIDHHALDHESGRLMRYVNLLHDPQGFLDMVDRNRQWMKDLYKKRGKIYEKMVTEELNMVIHNSLLNALANNGIYVSVEAFEEWEESGVPPEEFFDNTRKLIVPKGTPDYDIYYQLFEQASELKNEKTNPLRESLDTELKATLDTLDEKLEKELESVPKIDSKVEVATIEMENDIPITVNKINTELGPNQYAEALVTTEEGGKETTLFFKHEDGTLRYNNETGAVVKGATLKETFEKVNIFSMESVADPAYAQPIIDRYNDLKAEAIQEYALNKEKLEEEDTTPKEEFVPITTDMEPDSMPATLYNELYKLFKEQYLNKLNSEEFVNMTAEEERNVFRTFIQGSKEAKKIIEDFNAEVQLKADEKVTKKTTEKEDFDFLYQGKTVNTASIKTIAELRKYQERFKKSLKTLEDVKSPTAEDIAQRMAYQLLIADFEKLITTRSKVGRTPAMQKSIDLVTKLQSMQEGIEQSTLGYMINDQLHERVSNEIAKLESKKYAYKNQGSVNTAFYLNIGLENSDPKNKVNLTEANIDSFIEELRTRSLAGFSEYTYKKLKENLVNALSDETNLPNATNQDILDLITTTVSEETYEESRISGNYLDLQVKNLFDGQPVVFNEDNITKKAFDNLFGPKGILTALKAKVDAGELYIVSQGIRVYDSELNIAGEIDLLMVDSTGQITIVDVKSGLVDKWNGFNDPNNANSKLENYQLQQTAYANLLQRMLGVEAKIALLPIQMDREDETGKILKAGKPTKKDLLTSDIFIELDKGPVQERINSIIPLKEVTSAPIVTPTNTTTDTNVVQENKPRKPGYKNSIVKKEESTTKSGDKVTEYNSYAVDENGNEKKMTGGGVLTTVGELAAASQNSPLFYAEDENGDYTILKLDPNTRIKINKTIEGNDRKGNYQQRITVTLVDNDTFSGTNDSKGDFLTTKDIFSTPIYKTNTTTTDTKAEGTNTRGTTYKGETIEKDGLKVTKYSEFNSEGKRISKGGRIMTPAEFIKEYNITDQDYLDSLEGATEIRIYEVRVGKDGKAVISIQGTFPEGNVEMEIAGAELAALEETETNNTEDGEIIPSETEEITEVFVADSDRVTVAMIKDQLDKANTAQEVQTVVDNLNISVASEFVFDEDITEMVELIKAKKESLVVPQDMPIISESLEKGTELVAKKNIFTGAKNIVYATQDSILMVTNVDTVNKTVSVKALNSNKTIKIKFSDMNENFGLKTNLMNGTEKPDEPLTSEDKTFVSESIDLTTTFIEDKTKIDAIEKAASAKTIQELEDDLLEDIFC